MTGLVEWAILTWFNTFRLHHLENIDEILFEILGLLLGENKVRHQTLYPVSFKVFERLHELRLEFHFVAPVEELKKLGTLLT